MTFASPALNSEHKVNMTSLKKFYQAINLGRKDNGNCFNGNGVTLVLCKLS